MNDDPLQPYQTPLIWTPDHVMQRMIWAFDALRRLPVRTGPGSYASGWPGYVYEGGEIDEQKAMAEAEVAEDKKLNRYRERVVTTPPSTLEISMMEEAFGWPAFYLLWEKPPGVMIVEWARHRSLGRQGCSDINRVQIEAGLIAGGLRRDRVAIR